MANGLRRKMFLDLRMALDGNPLVKFSEPKSGETVKFKGVVLFKAFKISNPWNNRGVVVYRGLTESGLKAIEGRLSKGKKKWTGAPLTDRNYNAMLKILTDVVTKGSTAHKIMPPVKRVTKPKKKKY